MSRKSANDRIINVQQKGRALNCAAVEVRASQTGLDQSRITRAVKRVAVFGRPGSGKSVFAKSLSNALDVPLYHLA